jgi:hypothetical protein
MGHISEIVKGEANPAVTVVDLVSRKVMTIEVHENHASVKIGKEIMNITKEQIIAVMELINEQIQFIKPLSEREVKTDEDGNKK